MGGNRPLCREMWVQVEAAAPLWARGPGQEGLEKFSLGFCILGSTPPS